MGVEPDSPGVCAPGSGGAAPPRLESRHAAPRLGFLPVWAELSEGLPGWELPRPGWKRLSWVPESDCLDSSTAGPEREDLGRCPDLDTSFAAKGNLRCKVDQERANLRPVGLEICNFPLTHSRSIFGTRLNFLINIHARSLEHT